ncbi:hypothetical protein GGI21_004824, partial [Coemansia aciculifera]
NNAATQDTSLLDNILSQFDSTQQLHTLNHTLQSAADTDYTRVGVAMDEDDETRDVTMHTSLPEQAAMDSFAPYGQRPAFPLENAEMDDEDDEDVDSHEDAVTMELTGIFRRPPATPVRQVARGQSESESNTALLSSLGPILQTPQQHTLSPARNGAFGVAVASPQSTPFRTPQSGTQQQRQQPASGSLTDMLETLVATNPSAAHALSRIVASASPRTPERVSSTPVYSRVTPSLPRFNSPRAPATPANQYTPLPVPRSAVAASQSARKPSSTPKTPSNGRLKSVTPTPTRSSMRTRRTSQIVSTSVTESAATNELPREKEVPEAQPEAEPIPDPSFKLDSLPVIPSTASPLSPLPPPGPATLADHARAALVFGIFDAYRQQELVPKPLLDYDPQATYAMMYEPLYRKAKLTARLEYCSSLASLFEVDRDV